MYRHMAKLSRDAIFSYFQPLASDFQAIGNCLLEDGKTTDCGSATARSRRIPAAGRVISLASATGHFLGHFAGVAVSHAGDEIDHPQESAVQRPVRIGGVVAQQIEDPAILE